MHTGNHYRLGEILYWTRREIFVLLLLGIVPTALYDLAGWEFLGIPWVPVALIGTAAAFIVGFRNTQTYNRLWEARQIWGAIVNGSRSWGIMACDFVQHSGPDRQQLMYRHMAWLTALRFQLREHRSWEHHNKKYNIEYRRWFKVPEWDTSLEEALKPYLEPAELAYVLTKKNRATKLIALQSKHLAQLRESGKIGEYAYVEMQRRLADLYDQQGKCERIKNFPYPRQYASINRIFVWLFVTMLPFGILNEFGKTGPHCEWVGVLFSVLVSWMFTSMEKVGEATENPFDLNYASL